MLVDNEGRYDGGNSEDFSEILLDSGIMAGIMTKRTRM
jgi:hypothetical protein